MAQQDSTTIGPVRAVAYYRMSSDHQEASIPEQREWARQAAPKSGLHLAAEFDDEGIPGSEVEKRPGLQALMAYCDRMAKDNPVRVVVAWDGERFSRASSIRTAAQLDRLMTAGVRRLLTTEGWIDLTEDTDVVLFNLRQDLGRSAYSKAISRNVSRSMLSRARQGRWVNGRPPFGYTPSDDGKLTPNEQADVVRWIFREYTTTRASVGELAEKLNTSNTLGPCKGGKWNRHALRVLLRNRAYAGDIVFGSTTQGKYHRVAPDNIEKVAGNGTKPRKAKSESGPAVVVEDAHPALVDRATFKAAGLKLESMQRKRTTPFVGGGVWVLSGLVHCADCGKSMVGDTARFHRRGKETVYRYYLCRTRAEEGTSACHHNQAQQGVIVEMVAGLIQETFTSPERVALIRSRVEAHITGQAGQAEVRRRDLADRIATLERNIAAGTERLLLLPADLLDTATAKVQEWKAERDTLAGELAQTEAAEGEANDFGERVTRALARLQQIEAVLVEAPPEKARDLIGGMVSKITLHFDHEQWGPGKRGKVRERNTLRELEIDFHPDIACLLGFGGKDKQVLDLLSPDLPTIKFTRTIAGPDAGRWSLRLP